MTADQKLTNLHHLASEVLRTDGGFSQVKALIAAIEPEDIMALVDCTRQLQRALRDSGCDGDLCMHQWHEDARSALSSLGDT